MGKREGKKRGALVTFRGSLRSSALHFIVLTGPYTIEIPNYALYGVVIVLHANYGVRGDHR